MNERTIRVLEYEKIKNKLKKQATSQLGKELIEKLEPINDFNEVQQRLMETSEAVSLVIQKGNIPIGPIYDLKRYLKIAEIGSYLYPKQLLEVGDTLRTARVLKNFIKSEDSDKFSPLQSLISNISTYKNIESRIEEAIIGEDEISDNASPTLRNIRRQIENKNTAIRNKLNSIINSSRTQKFLQDAIITIRQDRFVVPVKAENKKDVPGLVHDQSASGATLFIEPMAIVEMNNELKELKLKEKAEIERILREISGQIGEVTGNIKINQEILANIDFIFAKAKLSLSMKGIEPKLNNRGYIRIKKGRHPLIDPNEVVPTDLWIGDKFDTLLITGPNTGGKTVTLKTVGLMVLMTQSGLHVPADYGTEISIFNQVYADIGDEQSIEQSLSTFSSHMTNIVEILKNVTNSDLVILDELGSGTDPTEGAALAMSILTHLYNKGVKTIATTHYSELKQFALSNEGIENACVEFDVETLSPTYRLLIGIPGKSNALEISRRLGLSEDIINKSKEFITNEDIEFEKIISTIESNRKTAEQERDEAIRLRLEVQRLKENYEKKYEKLQQQKDREIRKAKEEARKILKEAKREADEIVKELRNISKDVGKERNKRIEELRKKMKSNMEDLHEPVFFDEDMSFSEPPKNLNIGDSVKVLNLNQEGTVLTKPNQNGDLNVQVGIMKINVNISNLRLINEGKESSKKTNIGSIMKTKTQNIKKEIDLRGQTLEEASINLDKYLDDAYLAKLESVTIIHGKGTGALRKGIKDFLRRHAHVKAFREGIYGEGGSGVTIVELK
ncbi:endonuclease MutS2 [Paramaledivibacter caminithermalis]|jgi:DNA mismatch repair protein MutS2|uniref:Endonuclease MutS2 n=1 Tax=Paramaledivibacter caminithermalis (strain DSM 15212 / CIP 107654 / DViRD3) TaxID=1121301 RepID=A0A1M6PY11_PARC5|nr:endonuclease MutS2 [Paramaledivibacter caminithermalis]SHK12777.1 DNA mismatch repair protein MutS2 [Paramaledivibacter caminithermalis DSM 15212]